MIPLSPEKCYRTPSIENFLHKILDLILDLDKVLDLKTPQANDYCLFSKHFCLARV